MLTKILSITVILLLASCARRPQLQAPIGAGTTYPQQIAVMLPLTGQYSGNGKAVLNGFLAAYYDYLRSNPLNVNIDIVDTKKGNIKSLYDQAVDKGAIFVVGPLIKTNLNRLASRSSLAVPTLALNTSDNYTNMQVENLYQFGLSSQDEIQQMAQRAWQKSPGRALIIAPGSWWGKFSANNLQTMWQNLGGQVAETVLYNNSTSLETQIKHALNIDISQNNAMQLQSFLYKKLKFNPRRRQDLDTIFLIAPQNKARDINPLLAFYFAGNIPTYSMSLVYSGIPNPRRDRDLNGIRFCDIPWVLQDPWTLPPTLTNLHTQILNYWPKSYKKYPRFYALGIDAFYLMLKLNNLIASPQQGVGGATGILYLDKYHHIYRQLKWAQMRNGIPKIIS